MSTPEPDWRFPLTSQSDFCFQEEAHSFLPEWAIGLIKLGWWCRTRRIPGKRILAMVLLPTRILAGPLVSLGAVLAGAQQSKPGLTWDRLRTLPEGTELFWRWKRDSRSARGVIQASDDNADHLVKVLLTAGPNKNMIWSFSESTFSAGSFSEEKIPSGARLSADTEARLLLEAMGLLADSRWFASGTPEAALVTNCAEFSRSLAGVRVAAGHKVASLSDVLFASTFREGYSCKLQVVSLHSEAEKSAPLRILDGALAFRRLREGRADSNIIALFDRGEFGPELEGEVQRLQDSLRGLTDDLMPEISDVFHQIDVAIWISEADAQ